MDFHYVVNGDYEKGKRTKTMKENANNSEDDNNRVVGDNSENDKELGIYMIL